MKSFIILAIALFLSHSLYSQDFLGRLKTGPDGAKARLEKALTDSTVQNMIDKKIMLLSDKDLAIAVIEPVLFRTYGKELILSQKPYESYLIRGYWVIMGTLPDTMFGDTFLVILDARDSRIIQMTYGKAK